MPIDYSKWDNLDVSSSSEDEDDAPKQPRVTRLDAPSSVTFGGKDGSISASTKPPPAISSKPLPSTKPSQPSPTNNTPPSSWTDHGSLVKEGERNFYWTQDRYSVTLRLELSQGEKAKSVVVEGILPYADRWSAVGSTKPKLVCSSSDSSILLEGELPHPVHLAEEDTHVDWSVLNEGQQRFLVITLYKAVPMQGLTVWWRRPLTKFPEADLGEIRGESNKGTPASKDFLGAWEQAHKIFREGKQKRAEDKNTLV